MAVATEVTSRYRHGLAKQVTCPHCWERFAPEDVLWVASHADLMGDPRLGKEQMQRFLPTRFTVAGEALDARGFPCHMVACPKCHLHLPRSLLELQPLFYSIFGAQASGKSFYLAAMTWELRRILPMMFSMSFADSDPTFNRNINGYEESLFVNKRAKDAVPLGQLIEKTQLQGHLYETVLYGSQSVSYIRPFLFNLQPQAGHPNERKTAELAQVLCLYDNAGEHFEPGQDSTSNPTTRHLAKSRALFFVFDPTQDRRFRPHCRGLESGDAAEQNVLFRQEPILQEAATRIRRYAGLRNNQKHNRPLIVILSKYDLWSHLLGGAEIDDPWRAVSKGRVGSKQMDRPANALDVQKILDTSDRARSLLLRYCPEIVTAAEGFVRDVTYIPVSAIGWRGQLDEESGQIAIRPGDTQPYWVTVPFLYAMCRTVPGLIPALRRKSPQ